MPRLTSTPTTSPTPPPTVHSIHRLTHPTGRVTYILVLSDGSLLTDLTHETVLQHVSMAALQKYEHNCYKRGINMETRYDMRHSMGGWTGGSNLKTVERQIERSRKEVLRRLGEKEEGEECGDGEEGERMEVDTGEGEGEPPAAGLEGMNLGGSRRRLRSGDDTDREKRAVVEPRASKRRKLVDMVADEEVATASAMDTESDSIAIEIPIRKRPRSEKSSSDEIQLAKTPTRPTLPANTRTSRKETTHATSAPPFQLSPSTTRKSVITAPSTAKLLNQQQSPITQLYDRQKTPTPQLSSTTRSCSPFKQLLTEHTSSSRKPASKSPTSSRKPTPPVTIEIESDDKEDELSLSHRRVLISKPRPRTKSGLFFEASAASSTGTSTSPPPASAKVKKPLSPIATKTPKPLKAKTLVRERARASATLKPPESTVKKEETQKIAQKPVKKPVVVEEDDDEDNEEEEAMYEVEKILGHRDGEWGVREFYVKWFGYDRESDNTWEPEENLLGSWETVKEYVEGL